MARSLALGLYLLTTRGGTTASRKREPRPAGLVVWLRAGADAPLSALAEIARRVVAARKDATCLVTADGVEAPDLSRFPKGTVADADPGETGAAIESFLIHWRPEQLTLFTADLPPALIVAASGRGIPIVLISMPFARSDRFRWLWRPAMARALLSRMSRVIAPDPESAERLLALGDDALEIEITGPLQESIEAPACVEAERDALSGIFNSRPVWCAMSCLGIELDAVLSAHAHGLRLAHRLLLILVPDDPAEGSVFAERVAAAGMSLARRSQEEDPEAETQVLLADTEGEAGLWYRLAPVCFAGGSLLGSGPRRNPLEAALLGSAIVTGPKSGAYGDTLARLSQARAIRLVRTAQALSDAVAELILPDRAALLAHNAWAASTGSDEVIERAVEAISGSLGTPQPSAPAP